jgi:hypothetical protein
MSEAINAGFGGQDGLGSPVGNPDEIVDVPGLGKTTRAQIDKAVQYTNEYLAKVKEKAETFTNEQIIKAMRYELRIMFDAQKLYDMTQSILMLDEVAKSSAIAETLEKVLVKRLGIDPEKCKRKDCADCQVMKLIDAESLI